MALLAGRKPRPWSIPTGGKGKFSAAGYYLGQGSPPLEVAIAEAPSRPTESDVRNLWKRRKGKQPSPLLLIVLWPHSGAQRATVCGATGEDPPVYSDRDAGQAARLADVALNEPDHHSATRFLNAYLPEDSGGLRNVSLFATHHLADRVPQRADWSELCAQGERMLELRREQLVQALGFTVEPKGHAAVLRTRDNARALALFLDDSENPDTNNARFNGMTPVSWAIGQAASDNIPYVVLTRGPQIRVYTTRAAHASGKAGTSAFVELNLPLLTAEDAGYLPLLCSAESLAEGGRFEELLTESRDFATDLGSRLRARVYDYAVPAIAEALIELHVGGGGDTDDTSLAKLYDRALLVLFRLLFVAYAEDRDLLPLHSNGLYRQRSLKHLAHELADLANEHGWDDIPFDENATDLWDNVRALWAAVDNGRRDWNVPKYNGGMFSSEAAVNAEGYALTQVALTNAQFGPALLGLLVDEADDRYGAVDFASLDVREFGTIYEGLLESNLAVAPINLTLGKDDAWVPAGPKDEVWVEEGAVYLHNQSGARKATGSYFTKPFAVAHLLDRALEPALDAHIERLTRLVKAGKSVDAAAAFFDFRCVDLSMGSGHFLVAAVDRIERRLSEFLTDHRVPGVLDELARLSDAASRNLEDAGLESEGVDTNALLRRQIARRCIYGIDRSETAVELARLALWIHTFVKGLPLTSLNHGLVVGDSLTGIGTLDEAVAVLTPDAGNKVPFVYTVIEDSLASSREALARFASTSEATAAEIKEARQAHKDAEKAVEPARMLLDLAIAVRTGAATRSTAFDKESLLDHARKSGAATVADELNALHFPVAFPEVFMREDPGFDCILGNPPWEKVMVDERAFWSLRFPGIRSLPVGKLNAEIKGLKKTRPDLVDEYEREVETADAMREALLRGPFPDLGSGHPDLYKAFAWRFWQLVRRGGCIGVVLPRAAMSSAGMATWRLEILDTGDFMEVLVGTNTGGWMFDDAEHRYTICLVALRKTGKPDDEVLVRGPYRSYEEYVRGIRLPAVSLSAKGLRHWAEGAALPLIPSREAAAVFLKLRAAPRLDDLPAPLKFRPVQGDLNATNGKPFMVLDPQSTKGLWPVYKGASFNLWEPDTGVYYAYADPKTVQNELYDRRSRSSSRGGSAFAEMSASSISDPATLPCLHPRIAYRRIARATDTRTMIAALVPPRVILTDKAAYLLRVGGTAKDEAFLIGILSSMPLDWYARRIVEVQVDFHVINAFPIPIASTDEAVADRLVAAVRSLVEEDPRFTSWANELQVPALGGSRDDALAAIDACAAHLYGLDHDDLDVLFSTFHEGWDYRPRLERTFAALDELPSVKP